MPKMGQNYIKYPKKVAPYEKLATASFIKINVCNRPAEKFWVVTPQTSLKFLGQNLFGNQFWGQSEAGKV